MTLNKITIISPAYKAIIRQEADPVRRRAMFTELKQKVWSAYRAYGKSICADSYSDRKDSVLSNYFPIEAKSSVIKFDGYDRTDVYCLEREKPKIFLESRQRINFGSPNDNSISFYDAETSKLRTVILAAINNTVISAHSDASRYVAKLGMWRMRGMPGEESVPSAERTRYVGVVRLIPCEEPDNGSSKEWTLRDAISKLYKEPETSDRMIVFSAFPECDFDARRVADFLSSIGFENVSLLKASQQQKKGKTGLRDQASQLAAKNAEKAEQIVHLESTIQYNGNEHANRVKSLQNEMQRLSDTLNINFKGRNDLKALIVSVETALKGAKFGKRADAIAKALNTIDTKLKELKERENR